MRQAAFPDVVLTSAPQKAVFIRSDLRSGVQPPEWASDSGPLQLIGRDWLAFSFCRPLSKSWIEPDRMPFSYGKHWNFTCFSIPSQGKIRLTVRDGEPALSKQPKDWDVGFRLPLRALSPVCSLAYQETIRATLLTLIHPELPVQAGASTWVSRIPSKCHDTPLQPV